MTGYQESVTDPSYAGPDHRLHLPADRQLRRLGRRRWSPTASTPAASIMRDAKNREDVASAEGGWLDWLGDCGVPGDQRRRHPRAGPPHPRPRRDARRHLRRRARRGRGARADRRRALDGRRRPRPHRHPARAGPLRGRRAPRGRDRHRGQAQHRPPAARARLPARPCCPARPPPRRCWPRTPTSSSSPTAPATRRRSTTSSTPSASWSASARSFGICLGHQLLCRAVGLETFKLPFGHRGANHPVKDLATGPDRHHLPEPRLRGRRARGGEPRIEGDEPVRWETDFGAAELSHLNLYDRTVEGLVLRDVAGAHRPVPPRGRARPARRPPPLRQLPGARR